MKFIKENNRLAFKYKDEIIYIDEFLIVDINGVKDKDARFLYKANVARNKEDNIEHFIWNYCNNKVLFSHTNAKKNLNMIYNLILSNYLDKIIKLFKVCLKERCIEMVRYVDYMEGHKLIKYYIEGFKNEIKTLDKILEESEKIKADYNKLQSLKNEKIKEIEEIEKMF